MLTVSEILDLVTNSGVEVTLHFNHGFIAKGQVERSKDLVDTLPLLLRVGDSRNGENYLLFEPSKVNLCSFSDRRSIDLLFSARRHVNRTTPAPTILDLERLAQSESKIVNIQLKLDNFKHATDVMKWRLNDLIINLGKVITEIGTDELGQNALKQIRHIELYHLENSPFVAKDLQGVWTIIFDLKSIWTEEKIQSKELKKLIESHI